MCLAAALLGAAATAPGAEGPHQTPPLRDARSPLPGRPLEDEG